jgi:hypothetical protein
MASKLEVGGVKASGGAETNVTVKSSAANCFYELGETATADSWRIKSSGGDLYFQHDDTHADFTSGTNKLTISSAGLVGIGVSPDAVLHVKQTSTTKPTARFERDLASGSTNDVVCAIIQENSGDDKAALYIRQDGTGSLITAKDGTDTVFEVADGGLATFAGGINLGNVASATATTLDGYEEGTWTAALAGTTATIGDATGKYVRIGSLVWLSWYSSSTTLASSTGAAHITGLPFPNVSAGSNYTAFTYQHGNAVDGGSRGGYFTSGGTTMFFIDTDSSASSTFVDGSGKYIMMSGVYQTTAAF